MELATPAHVGYFREPASRVNKQLNQGTMMMDKQNVFSLFKDPYLLSMNTCYSQIVSVVLGVTHCRIKMVDDVTDNRKELEMPRTQLFVRLSGTHMLRYGDFQRLFLCLEATKPLNRALKRFFKIL